MAIVVLGVELFLFWRSVRPSHGEGARVVNPIAPPVVTEPAAYPAPPAAETVRTTATTSAVAAVPDGGQDGDEGASRGTTVTAALRRRDLLVAAHNQQAIQEADERVFSQLSFADAQRVAIRLLNERQARQRQDQVAAERDDLTAEQQGGASIAIGDRVARERQAGLKEILGIDGAQSFQVAEAAEIRRLQRRYRVQWAQELDEQAPMPAGAPPRAH